MNQGPNSNSDQLTDVLGKAYEEHASDLYRYALMILADHQAAEDAVHQAFMKTMKLGNHIIGINSLGDYLRTVVRNASFDIIKKRGQVKQLPDKPILEQIDKEVSNEEERKLIEKALKKLPAEQREVIYLKIYEDKTFEDIALITGASINTIASRYRYSIDKLRETLTVDELEKEG